jgi:hypothetical protein
MSNLADRVSRLTVSLPKGLAVLAATVAVLSGAACAGIGNSTPSPEEFVVLRRADTVRVERFVVDERRMRSVITRNYGEVDSLQAWSGLDGAIDSVLIVERDPERSVQHAVFRDSTVQTHMGTEARMADETASTSSRAMPFYSASISLMEAVLRKIKLGEGESRTIVLGNSKNALHSYSLTRMGDTVLVADNRRLYWLAVDEHMNIKGGRTRAGDGLVRQSARDGPNRPGVPRPGWIQPGLTQFGKCPLSARSLPASPIAVEINDRLDGRLTHLRSDGKGVYTHGSQDVLALDEGLIQMNLPGLQRGRKTPAARSVTFDLSQPVAGSGSTSLGEINDTSAVIGVIARKDAASDSIFGPRDLAVGEEVPAARVALALHIGAETGRHVSWLSFGPFAFNSCAEALAVQENVGTTTPTLKRISSTAWTVTIPFGSIGRLWYDAPDEDNYGRVARDRGLYSFSGRFRFSLVP